MITHNIPEGKKVVYDKMDISIGAGNTSFADQIKLREGQCIGAKIIDFTSAIARAYAINVGVTDSAGSEMIAQTDFRDFIQNGGGYFEGLKPACFSTRSQVSVKVTSTTAIAPAEDFSAQIIFAVLIDK